MGSLGRVDQSLFLQIILLCFIDVAWCQSLCSRVQSFGPASGVVEAVGRISNSIGYSGISGVAKELLINSTDDSCRIKLVAMQNRAGEIVQPSVDSAQSAVRSRANALLFQSACPGFGMCADVLDADDYDVWPITAMTVSQTD
jgi:ABC-type phosphate transport system substrate-binding protein